MTRITTTLALAVGVFIGLGAAQLLQTAQAQAPDTLVQTDGGIILFIVGGQEKARIDPAGLHVNGDIGYSGVITDTITYDSAPATEHAR